MVENKKQTLPAYADVYTVSVSLRVVMRAFALNAKDKAQWTLKATNIVK